MSKKSDFTDSIKQPDSFVSTSHVVLHWIERHSVVMGSIVALGAALGLSYTGYNFYVNKTESSAAESIYKVESQLKKAESSIRDERAKKMQELASGKTKTAKAAEDARPVDYAKDYAPIVNSMKAALKDQSGTRAAMVSALNLSYFLVQQKQFQEALEVMKTPTKKPSAGDLLSGFWHMHYALVLLENNQADEALKLYSEVLATPDLKPFHAEAMLKSGVASELKGDAPKAKDIYEKIGREFPNTEAASSASQYLRLMELKAKG